MKLKVGDKVTSDYWHDENDVIRKITAVYKDSNFTGGLAASADCGGICPCCKRPLGKEISYVNISWFKKVEEQ